MVWKRGGLVLKHPSQQEAQIAIPGHASMVNGKAVWQQVFQLQVLLSTCTPESCYILTHNISTSFRFKTTHFTVIE